MLTQTFVNLGPFVQQFCVA